MGPASAGIRAVAAARSRHPVWCCTVGPDGAATQRVLGVRYTRRVSAPKLKHASAVGASTSKGLRRSGAHFEGSSD